MPIANRLYSSSNIESNLVLSLRRIGELWMNRQIMDKLWSNLPSLIQNETNGPFFTAYKPYTLVGPTVTRPVQDPLAVLLLDNRLNLYALCTLEK